MLVCVVNSYKKTGFRGILMRTYTNPRVDMGDSVKNLVEGLFKW